MYIELVYLSSITSKCENIEAVTFNVTFLFSIQL